MNNREMQFCGIMMSRENYDDDAALRAYVAKHCRHLMTPLERRTSEYTVPILSDYNLARRIGVHGGAAEKAARLYQFLEDRDGHVDDAEVVAVFKQIDESTRISAPIDRLLAECRDELNVNRCPACSRITRSPLAKQCPWCVHSWHNS